MDYWKLDARCQVLLKQRNELLEAMEWVLAEAIANTREAETSELRGAMQSFRGAARAAIDRAKEEK